MADPKLPPHLYRYVFAHRCMWNYLFKIIFVSLSLPFQYRKTSFLTIFPLLFLHSFSVQSRISQFRASLVYLSLLFPGFILFINSYDRHIYTCVCIRIYRSYWSIFSDVPLLQISLNVYIINGFYNYGIIMRVKEMHPLCCISLESPAIGDGTPEPILLRTGSVLNLSGGGSDFNAGGSDVSSSSSVAGILYKWTNYGKGWRSRWFTLRSNGVLSYSKTRRPETVYGCEDVVFIGHVKAPSNSGTVNIRGKHSKTVGTVHLKVGKLILTVVLNALYTLIRVQEVRQKQCRIEIIFSSKENNIPVLNSRIKMSLFW